MKVKLLCFGITKEILGAFEKEIELEHVPTVANLKAKLIHDFPEFGSLISLQVAVNEEYASDDWLIGVSDEVVLIPPVSGG